MIDEKKLIRYIKAQINPYGKPFTGTAYEFGLKVINYIENMNKVGEWIPCSERLPSEADFIASYGRNKYSAEFVVMIEGATRPTTLYFRKTGSWVDENGNLHKVTAWQPLPEAYNPGMVQKQTNADRIRNMDDEDLAMNMMCPNESGLAEIDCDKSDNCNCYECLLKWLQSEVEE